MKSSKEIIIGFIVGIIANTFGTLLYILLFSDLGIVETFNAAIEQGHIGSLLALGAILNLVAVFRFFANKERPKGQRRHAGNIGHGTCYYDI